MVWLRKTLPRRADGEPVMDAWLDAIVRLPPDSRGRVCETFAAVTEPEARTLGLELAELLLGLRMDAPSVMAGMTFFAVTRGNLGDGELACLDPQTAALIDAVQRLSTTDVLAFADSPLLSSERKTQAGNVRSMLISLIDDPRVAVIKLAERVVALGQAKHDAADAQRRAAREGLAFFAPLAGRLGIGQLKWAIEDLAFRYLYPAEYSKIASLLVGRRAERERHVEAVRQDLTFLLEAKGVHAEVHGRAKHIYSIWQKMRRKGIGFASVHDVQALRVLVDDIEACYKVLGVVHTQWPHIRNEFDDYITNPKENGYRSIHTAVIGPMGRMLEVQIRTHEMHEEAELGVCAHWAYKGDDEGEADKANWLRSVLDWHDELNDAAHGAGRAADGAESPERTFVTTPQGHVVDLSVGATALDFAFRIHTDVGLRCSGALVDGKPTPLNVPLRTGQSVDVQTSEAEAPKREWLNPSLGYVTTARARSKIQAWFRGQLAESNIRAGESLLRETLERLGLPAELERLANSAGYDSVNALALAVGVGDQLVVDLVHDMLALDNGQEPNQPDEPDAGTGTLHDLTLTAQDRNGLMLDVMAALAELSVPVTSVNAEADRQHATAIIRLTVLVADIATVAAAVERLRSVASMTDVRRNPINTASPD